MPSSVRAGAVRDSNGRTAGIDAVLKRVMDVAVSSLALLLLAPLLVTTGVLIRLTSRGPALFAQTRVGARLEDGRWVTEQFRFLKFRTMYVEQGHDSHRRFVTAFIKGDDASISEAQTPGATTTNFKLSNDPRVTTVGRFLRKSSLDELPQLWNVLRGEMTLVGPRPPLPYEVELYDPMQMRRLEAKPGMTGLWQISGRSSTTFDEMVRLDVEYIERRSFWLDLYILAKTIPVVLTAKGVE